MKGSVGWSSFFCRSPTLHLSLFLTQNKILVRAVKAGNEAEQAARQETHQVSHILFLTAVLNHLHYLLVLVVCFRADQLGPWAIQTYLLHFGRKATPGLVLPFSRLKLVYILYIYIYVCVCVY